MKQLGRRDDLDNPRSHPAWVRGLKLNLINEHEPGETSHPAWVRGLKRITSRLNKAEHSSHPAWVRGLKRRRR